MSVQYIFPQFERDKARKAFGPHVELEQCDRCRSWSASMADHPNGGIVSCDPDREWLDGSSGYDRICTDCDEDDGPDDFFEYRGYFIPTCDCNAETTPEPDLSLHSPDCRLKIAVEQVDAEIMDSTEQFVILQTTPFVELVKEWNDVVTKPTGPKIFDTLTQAVNEVAKMLAKHEASRSEVNYHFRIVPLTDNTDRIQFEQAINETIAAGLLEKVDGEFLQITPKGMEVVNSMIRKEG